MMTIAATLGAVMLVVAAGVWVLMRMRHPESAAGHDPGSGPRSTSDDLYRGADRPAGPDAEAMDPDELGGDQRPPT
jgi:hypothetical protein